MTTPVDPAYAKSASAKQIKKTLIKPKGKAAPCQPEEIQDAVRWTQEMVEAGDSARKLWKAYLTEDAEIFDEVVKQIGPTPSAIRLALKTAHQERSPSIPSKLGAASSMRYEPIKSALLAAWSAAQATGSKKSKPQFVKDWSHQQEWPAGSIKPKLQTLERWLPKKAT